MPLKQQPLLKAIFIKTKSFITYTHGTAKKRKVQVTKKSTGFYIWVSHTGECEGDHEALELAMLKKKRKVKAKKKKAFKSSDFNIIRCW